MNNYLNILTTDTLKAIYNINKDNVYFNDKSLNYLAHTNNYPNIKSNMYKVLLATGTIFTCSEETILNGLIYESYIKNDLDFESVVKYKENDYIFTPYINLNLDQTLSSLSLKNYSNHFLFKGKLYFLIKDISKNKDYNVNLKDLFKLLTNEYISENSEQSIKELLLKDNLDIQNPKDIELFITQLTNKYFKNVEDLTFITESFIDFLLASTLRCKIKHEITEFNFTIKTMSFKFIKNNETHDELYKNLINFFKTSKYEYEEVEYESYYFVNLINNPIIDYYEHFYSTSFNDLKYMDNDLKLYFLKNLYRYTNNNFYSNFDIYLTLKYIAYSFKITLKHERNKNKNVQPYVSSILEQTEDFFDEYPDLIELDEGYLTRIVNIEYLSTNGRPDLIYPFLILS